MTIEPSDCQNAPANNTNMTTNETTALPLQTPQDIQSSYRLLIERAPENPCHFPDP